jgi:hypothetical protein
MDYIKTMKTLEEYNEKIQDLKKRQARYLSEDCRLKYGEKMTQYSIGLFDKLISEVMSERAKLIGKK